MKVRILEAIAGQTHYWQRGDVVDVPDDYAQRMLKARPPQCARVDPSTPTTAEPPLPLIAESEPEQPDPGDELSPAGKKAVARAGANRAVAGAKGRKGPMEPLDADEV